MHLLQTLASQGDGRLAAFEQRHSLAAVVSAVDAFPPGLVEGAIKRYQDVIRGNSWYFPTLSDVDLPSFLVRWGEVHAAYFSLADDIFAHVVKGGPSALATPSLLTRVIQSETMRGWVGKRSPSGLDALLAARVAKLEIMLEPLGDDAVEDVLSYGGVYIGNPTYVTAEHEIIELFAAYHRAGGQELTLDTLDSSREAQTILRGYCRYSLDEFNAKYRALRKASHPARPMQSAASADSTVKQWLTKLPSETQSHVRTLLDEVKALNYLNLNLEVKYSFKGWAGLMHVLVLGACSITTGIDTDVYAMLGTLKKAGK